MILRRYVGALTGPCVLMILSACTWVEPVDGKGPRPPDTATIVPASSFAWSGTKCVDTLGTRWGATPVSVPAGPGSSRPVAETDPPKEWLASGGLCRMSHTFRGLQPGRWRVWVDAGVASGACEADFAARQTWINLANNACEVGP